MRVPRAALLLVLCAGLAAVLVTRAASAPPRTCRPLHPIQEEMTPFVHDMLTDAYHAYFENAFPHDVLNSLSANAWREELGGYGLTLIDALDMLAIMGRHEVFRRVAKWLEENVNFDRDVMVSAFETNIRTVGGLLSAHFMYEEGLVPVVPEEHDYKGGLLVLAVDMGTRLLATYKSALGLLFNSLNLKRGVMEGETANVANAAAGTFSVEMMLLSRLTGDPRFETAARWAQQVVHDLRIEDTSLMGNHISGDTGDWVGLATSVGTSIDSTLEYTLKSHVLTGGVDEWVRYEVLRRATHKFLGRNGFYLYASAASPTRWLLATHESLAAFYPGLLLLGGQRREASSLVWASHALWRRYGALAEMTDLRTGRPSHGSESYPLRPEHIESIYHLYRATRDPVYLEMGREAALSLHLRTRTAFGFSGLNNVEKVDNHKGLSGEMESFLMAETLKYLYLLFDECNPIHAAERSRSHSNASTDTRESTVGWVFTTEAHPIPNHHEWWEESAPWQRQSDEPTTAGEKHTAPPQEPQAAGVASRDSLAANDRLAPRPAFGALFPAEHSKDTASAFDELAANGVHGADERVNLFQTVISTMINDPMRAGVPTYAKTQLLTGVRDRARPYMETSSDTRKRHIQGLLQQVESELLGGGMRGGFTSSGGLNNAEDSCQGDSHWQLALAQLRAALPGSALTLATALRDEEELIRYEYFCSNHLFADTDYLTHSLNYMR